MTLQTLISTLSHNSSANNIHGIKVADLNVKIKVWRIDGEWKMMELTNNFGGK